MSPETIDSNIDIIEQAARISDELLQIQEQVDAVASAKQSELLEGVRPRLGYPEVDYPGLNSLVDKRIEDKSTVISPEALSIVLPLTAKSIDTTLNSRHAAEEIIDHSDDRLLVVVGPCSIHDPEAALEYAGHVLTWREQFGDELEVVMRFYNEKPRTEKDWKGLIYDPMLDGSDNINLGIVLSRLLMCRVTDMGVPLATERLNAHTPQFLNGLIAYDAIGARNAEDQKSREYGSGTSSVLGQKHNQHGDINSAINAIVSENFPHSFLGTKESGLLAQVQSRGNQTAHLILRGTKERANYSRKDIQKAKAAIMLARIQLPLSLIIDFSHGNSRGVARNQLKGGRNVGRQISDGERAIVGAMIESYLVEGKQPLKDKDDNYRDKSELVYGQSITDECLGLEDTQLILQILQRAQRDRHKRLTPA